MKAQKNLAMWISVVAALAAAFFAWQSNSNASEATKIAARTFLAVSPMPVTGGVIPDPLFEERARSLDGVRFVVVAGKSDGLKVWLKIAVTDQGGRAAKNATLSVDLSLVHKNILEQEIRFAENETFVLGDIGLGETVAYNVSMQLQIPTDQVPGPELQEAFEKNIVRAKVKAQAKYETTSNEEVNSGVFVGESRDSGRYLGRIHKTVKPAN